MNGRLEIAALSVVWLLAAAWLLRKDRPQGAWRHGEGALTLMAALGWGLWTGAELWNERYLALALVLLPHSVMLGWSLVRRRDRWAAAAAVLGAMGALVTGSGLRYVHTPSVPMGLYRAVRVDESGPIEVGQTVCLDPHSGAAPRVIGRFVPTDPGGVLVKKVLATPGDGVDYDGQSLWIDGSPVALSHIWATSRAGARLPHLSFPQLVGEGQLWLGSDHNRGFDSRYFGPVARRAITCVAEAVWLR
jgi:conjugative transfer signal peptidase TraF